MNDVVVFPNVPTPINNARPDCAGLAAQVQNKPCEVFVVGLNECNG